MEALVAQLRAQLAEKERQFQEALARIEALEALVASLQANSRNSSKPPSSDGPAAKPRGTNRTKPKKKRKKKGGQPGRKPARRELLPADREEVCRPSACKSCAADLGQERPSSTAIFQQIDAPPVKPVVTNFKSETICCNQCGTKTTGAFPAIAKVGFLGPHLASIVAMMTGKYRLSKREVINILRDMTGVRISLGSVCNTEQKASAAVQAPVIEALRKIRREPSVHMDETGWRQGKQRRWLWLSTTANLAVFGISRSRGTDAAIALIGSDFGGILVTDRWGAYGFVAPERRQLCWAHLKRDFQSWVDLGGRGAQYGDLLLREVWAIFSARKRYASEKISEEACRNRMKKIRIRCKSLLRKAMYHGREKIRGMAKQMLRHESSLWVFIEDQRVAPTNNHAERVLRPAVLWRKGSFGTDSSRGSQYVARILSVAASLRLQGREFLPFVRESLLAFAAGKPGPSLLSTS